MRQDATLVGTPVRPPKWKQKSRLGRVLTEMRRDKVGAAGLLLLAGLIVVAIIVPVFVGETGTVPNLADRLIAPVWSDGGMWSHPLGTDALGRDMLVRLILGARTSLLIGGVVVLVAGVFGVAAGLLAGFKGGWWGSMIMSVVDTQVAFPGLLLALMILTVLGASGRMVIVVLAINGWMVYARITRGAVLSLKESGFVQAAETVGCPSRWIVRKHLLPNLVSPLLTLGTLEFARIVLAEASLSYLGMGIQPPETSWGLMVAEGQSYITVAWWTITFPGLAIASIVLLLNLVASWLRVLSDPQARAQRFLGSVPH